jgi:hypothetical protein
VPAFKKGRPSITPDIDSPTLTVVAVRWPTHDRVQHPLADSLKLLDFRTLGPPHLASHCLGYTTSRYASRYAFEAQHTVPAAGMRWVVVVARVHGLYLVSLLAVQ